MGPAHQGGRDFCGLMVVKGPNRPGVTSSPAGRPPFSSLSPVSGFSRNPAYPPHPFWGRLA